jgi:hypothetical protein
MSRIMAMSMLTTRRSSSHSAQTSSREGSVDTGGTGAETASVTSSKSVESGSAANVSVIAADIHLAPEPLSIQTAVEIGQFKVQFGNIIWHDLLARQAERSAEYDCMQDKFPKKSIPTKQAWKMRWTRLAFDGSLTLWTNDGVPAEDFRPIQCVIRVYPSQAATPEWWIHEKLEVGQISCEPRGT